MQGFSEHYGWVEIVFTALVPLGFGLWQYWSVSREIKRDKDAKARKPGDD
tara:strand:- start:211 stop:360 length:150 start_codon:yes stop_codon:yes gene_type:complete